MIFQIPGEFAEFAWVFGIGLLFGLSLLINTLLKGDTQTLFIIMLAINGIIVIGQLLEEWTLILTLIFNIVILVNAQKSDK